MTTPKNVQHMVLILGTAYVPVDVEAESSAEAVELLAQFLKPEAFIADAASDKRMVRSRAANDILTLALRAVSAAQEVVSVVEADE